VRHQPLGGAAHAAVRGERQQLPGPVGAAVFPGGAPPAVPVPPGTHVDSSTKTAAGLIVVRFSTPTSLRQGILFILGAYASAASPAGHPAPKKHSLRRFAAMPIAASQHRS